MKEAAVQIDYNPNKSGKAIDKFIKLYALHRFMYHTLKNLPIENYLDSTGYCLAIFRCGEENEERAIVLIEKSSGGDICELLEDKDGLIGGSLAKSYSHWKQEKLEGESLEIVMRLYFNSNGSNIDRVFDYEIHGYND